MRGGTRRETIKSLEPCLVGSSKCSSLRFLPFFEALAIKLPLAVGLTAGTRGTPVPCRAAYRCLNDALLQILYNVVAQTAGKKMHVKLFITKVFQLLGGAKHGGPICQEDPTGEPGKDDGARGLRFQICSQLLSL